MNNDKGKRLGNKEQRELTKWLFWMKEMDKEHQQLLLPDIKAKFPNAFQ